MAYYMARMLIQDFNMLEAIPNLQVNQWTINSLLTRKSVTRSSHPGVCSVTIILNHKILIMQN